MKKFKKIAFFVLFLIIIILSFTIYTNASKNNENAIREKSLSEIKYVESKLINLFNSLNNIEFENYKISSQEINSQKNSDSSNSSSNSNSSKEGEGDSSSSGNNSESSNAPLGNNNKKYSLTPSTVLSQNSDINWDYIKKEAEEVSSAMPSITLDLYDISLNQSDILNFNKEYDNLLSSIKQEDKEKTMSSLNTLYSYIPKFIKNCSNDKQYKTIINTKQYILSAYSILDSEDWDKINAQIKLAVDTYSKLITDINLETEKQYNINKVCIMINDIQNSTTIKSKDIFLIKYKNIIEELNTINI